MNIESISYLLWISGCCRRLRVVFAEVERVDEKGLSVVAGGVEGEYDADAGLEVPGPALVVLLGRAQEASGGRVGEVDDVEGPEGVGGVDTVLVDVVEVLGAPVVVVEPAGEVLALV